MSQCSNCGNTSFVENPSNFAISSWKQGPEGPILNVADFMPVKIKNCQRCGKLDIYFDLSQRDNVSL